MVDRVITLAKARKELEDIYSGVPDESVNLTFGDMAEVQPIILERNMSDPFEPIKNNKSKNNVATILSKIPSVDFSRALEATVKDNHRVSYADYRVNSPSVGHPFMEKHRVSPFDRVPHHQPSPYRGGAYDSRAHEDMSGMSMGATVTMSSYKDGCRGKRPGIPHSNICNICSNYIYMFKHRCLVCGRVYCKSCGGIGMGEMTEGRKCVDCLGQKFSLRYIHKAGQVSCCMRFRYSSEVMQKELKWAEKGPRKAGERRYGQSGLMSTSRSPRNPSRPNSNQGATSFVMSSPYSSSPNYPFHF